MFTKSIISKLGLAAAIIAVGSFASAGFAEAKRGDRDRDRGNRSARNAPVNNHVVNNHDRRKNRKAKKIARAIGAVALAIAASQNRHSGRRDIHAFDRHYDRHASHRADRGNRWNRGRRFRNRHYGRSCVAVAKTRHGYGRRIGGIRAKAFGRRACRKAVNRCENKLYDRRQSRGRNPHASCVVVRRG